MLLNNDEFAKFNTRQFLVGSKPLKFVPAINTGLKVYVLIKCVDHTK